MFLCHINGKESVGFARLRHQPAVIENEAPERLMLGAGIGKGDSRLTEAPVSIRSGVVASFRAWGLSAYGAALLGR